MKRSTIRTIAFFAALSLLVIGTASCGKYGPPERAEPVEQSQ
ncbi:MAG: hypothetical protein ACR2PQ_00635 [Myxococcota bacterium]